MDSPIEAVINGLDFLVVADADSKEMLKLLKNAVKLVSEDWTEAYTYVPSSDAEEALQDIDEFLDEVNQEDDDDDDEDDDDDDDTDWDDDDDETTEDL